MHPLQETLDTSQHEFRHEGPVKRRTSLDNSCLSAHESMRMLLPDPESYEGGTKPRRYSLTHKMTITATFMADTSLPKQKDDALDMDCHNSTHSRAPAVSIDGLPIDELSEDDIFDSDCDSFCDASVQEQANKEYLIKDLGASCFWGGEASLSDFQFLDHHNHHNNNMTSLELSMPDVIEEEGHEQEQAIISTPTSTSTPRRGSRRNPVKKIMRKVRG